MKTLGSSFQVNVSRKLEVIGGKKMILQDLENQWEELSDAQLEKISGGTIDVSDETDNQFLPIIAGQENSVVNNGPNIGQADTAFAIVSQLTGVVGKTGAVFTLNPTEVVINPATPPGTP